MKIINVMNGKMIKEESIDFYRRDKIYLSVDCFYLKKWTMSILY